MTVLDEKIDRLRGIIRKLLADITTPFEEQSRLIKYLKILDPESDPAWDCMIAYHGWLESMLWELQRQFHAQGFDLILFFFRMSWEFFPIFQGLILYFYF
jgi:hypothetical protein